MQFDVITLFPEMFSAITQSGITRRAFEKKQYSLNLWNPRNFSSNNYRKIDDYPYGGGVGMIMLGKPIEDTITAIKKNIKKIPKIIYMSPQGKKLTHNIIIKLLKESNLILLCGRYQAIDQRFLDNFIDEEISVGDFILSGGELPAMMLIDAIVRLLPKVLNNKLNMQDSFINGLLDCSYYTKPRIYLNMEVPIVLLSGNHKKIKKWKRKNSLKITNKKRPDLIIKARKNKFLTCTDEEFLKKINKK
ncbi:tRNA (guanosine(37)-N1)-methyltransferase TrmD [Candidatus Profftella armatura]|uniref:tRNA (guanine-N(1)-)-methyltransferase n=1 Tax=Candidatus Profftella armatura TaxID=669502 RepID=S5R4A1_9PROT|nr:tRNA (guanosine(37)-N1)-methyltransferase TrmD [Candidatus Profftella armatura]AGS07034.1 tRNA (guanine-N1)-methyltransferase [Candidatus Profftella armatura]ALC96093.1 tRNA (guanine-N1)-methyltransferase [Candidatus Profftella armatura]QLK13929.1 tRNA (guanosine(37)-N1)-methyltransferase TrmD [Candidatus Profftella armatura]